MVFKPRLDKEDHGWYCRGYLPHFDGQRTQFLTFRLCDSVPQERLEAWRREANNDAQFRKKVERFMDAGYGACWLRYPEVARMVCDSLIFHDPHRYDLHAWVVMPNHVHVMLTPNEGFHLDQIEHSIKSYTANEANKLLGRRGQFWAIECFDRYIRDLRHFNAVIRYIDNNPVKARLCSRPEEWRFGSAGMRWKAS